MADSYQSAVVLTTCFQVSHSSCCMDPKVLRLNILINCSQTDSWLSNGSVYVVIIVTKVVIIVTNYIREICRNSEISHRSCHPVIVSKKYKNLASDAGWTIIWKSRKSWGMEMRSRKCHKTHKILHKITNMKKLRILNISYANVAKISCTLHLS